MSVATPQQKPVRDLPILRGILPIRGSQIPADVIAGITLAALAIPEVIGYTKISGTPVVTGLYTLLIPMALFALFGSSRHLVVAADSATAAIMAAGLAGLAATGSAQYMAYAEVLALLAGTFLMLARVIRLGFLADFLSRTALIGFLTGVGIQVAIGQISGMLGIPGIGSNPLQQLMADLRQLTLTHLPTLGVSLAVLAIIVGARRINKRIPGALIAVVAAILVSYFASLSAHGVALIGTVPGGLPQIGLPQIFLPNISLDWATLQHFLAIAFSMSIVILTQSAATSRAYAARYDERFSENVDLVGLSLANVGASLSGTFVVNGSPTKTQMVASAGGGSQLAHLFTSLIVLVVLLFLTGPLSLMPDAALAAVVFLIGLELVDVKGLRRILAERPVEFWVALITAAIVVFAGVEQGIILAMLLSLLAHTRHGYRARNAVIEEREGHFNSIPLANAIQVTPGLVMYRFNHGMYYANSEQLSEEIRLLEKVGPSPLAWFCINLRAVDDVDFTAAATLRTAAAELKGRNIRLVFCGVSEHVRHELDVSGITDLCGQDAYYFDLRAVLEAYRNQP